MLHLPLHPDFERLIDLDAAPRQVGTGYIWIEGPVWHPSEDYLLFSDIPGDVRRRWDGVAITEVMRPSHNGNGMTYDRTLNLLICEQAKFAVTRYSPDGKPTILATHFEGRTLNSPNDIVVRDDGSIYFTDPLYGRMPEFGGVDIAAELGFQGVYRIPPDGEEPQLLVDRETFGQPNGLCFSPDERLLYINDTEQTNIRVYDVQSDGSLFNGRIFADGIVQDDDPGLPDGMKCDELGNVWVTAPGGLWVYSPDGDLIGKVQTPERVGNFHWGGRDWRTLYLAASSSLYTLETKIGPRKEPFMLGSAI
ncbi:SMP-30/gluconolactonase/LRE family protein [Sphingomonas ginsenosidivorax]|uniref:SMP-30/gluconolactonase/LRE family protein n=1 Tax=Sphingomonas ginsenosidivorax TaxID=862135 RepID=A0A5C6U533_9SPHN|nr:SMP-30/gluconolactonase/LRE family protein [Sphingomonas ginsenosidivorax]TXC67977.1 SMP-30/gluconolactonase/LRE family protein [Sphingomonas ginsenosidivorax]